MAREIKFRAWDKVQKCWLEAHEVYIDLNGKLFSIDADGDTWAMPKSIELVRYTCLKDKNGVEIYEGDIVKTQPTPEMTVPYIILEVIWGADKFSDGDQGFIFYDHKVKQGNFIRAFGDVRKPFEVIGNIYDDPELLN